MDGIENKLTLPSLGESIHTANIVKWLKKVGETVKRDEALVEVTTDKVASEIPSPFEGILTEILVHEGQDCDIGQPICKISSVESNCKVKEKTNFYSPAVLKIIQEKQIPLSEISKLPGTGGGGRITKQDVLDFSASKDKGTPISPVRKIIAENMTRSALEIPQATLINEIDVTKVLSIMKEKKEKVKLTITSFIAHAICQALAKFPQFNASFEKDQIIYKEEVNLGVAVDYNENLFVPVIKNCQKLTIVEIAQHIRDLVEKVKSESIKNEDLQNGTLTLTNFGMTGVSTGIPLIRPPEAAILGVGSINKKVVILKNDQMAIRSLFNLSLSFDHRIADGMLSCAFLNAIKENLEQISEL